MKNGLVVTFYSYKGGVGRSFNLAKIEALLAVWGYKVLCVDWDLESPDLSEYLERWDKKKNSGGVLEVIEHYEEGDKPDWKKHVTRIGLPDAKGQLDFMRAGIRNDEYNRRLQRINWELLYSEKKLGNFIEKIRGEWKEKYDYILIDSRMGVTDIGGISTIQLGEILMGFFTANYQSLNGLIGTTRQMIKEHNKLPYDRGELITLPVLSRFDMSKEYELGREWLKIVEKKVKPLYEGWLDKDADISAFINYTRVPYISYWSFGERLPVTEDPRRDPDSINYKLENLAALIAKGCSETKKLIENRDAFVSSISKEIVPPRRVHDTQKLNLRKRCQEIIKEGEMIAWKRFIDELGKEVTDKIIEWKPKGERAAHQGGEEWEKAVLEVAEICLPGFVPILTAIDKGKKGFWRESISTLRKLAILEGRMGGGATWVLNIGARMLYIAGSLGAAVAVETKQIDFVNDWMLLPMPNPDSDRHEEIAWAEASSAHRLPKGMGIVYKEPFKLLLKICESDYVAGFFPNKERIGNEYLFLANLLQSLVELRRSTEKEQIRKALEEKKQLNLDVWPLWCLMKSEDFESCTWDLFGSSKGVLNFVFPGGTTISIEKFWSWWKNWKAMCAYTLDRDFRQGFLDAPWQVRWLRLPGEPVDKDY